MSYIGRKHGLAVADQGHSILGLTLWDNPSPELLLKSSLHSHVISHYDFGIFVVEFYLFFFLKLFGTLNQHICSWWKRCTSQLFEPGCINITLTEYRSLLVAKIRWPLYRPFQNKLRAVRQCHWIVTMSMQMQYSNSWLMNRLPR